MKKIFSIATIILFGCPLNLIANTPTITSESVIWHEKSENSNRPKVPSRQQISCFYEKGSLNFQFAIPEGECQLTVTDMTTGFARQYVFDSSAAATVYVGVLTQAHVEISTANGREYEGWLAMEG
ncbi:MAG: hypothetical protein J6L79_06735 [Muribaculaceae bacterium]|nr:hypothetical protein [Muribaculaceae bacterium]